MKSFPILDVQNNLRLPKSKHSWWIAAVLSLIISGAVWSYRSPTISDVVKVSEIRADAPAISSSNASSAQGVKSASSNSENNAAKPLEYEVLNVYPHDARAFTQGLVWHNNGFYESTGLNGESTLRRVGFPSGRVLVKRDVPPQYFAEGLAMADDRLVQITWKSGKAFVYSRATFKLLTTWSYKGEGWGLAFDGKQFVMSDGSDSLCFRSAKDFQIVRSVRVTMNGEPLNQLNELEIVNGQIWANVWQTDYVVQIDPQNGRVVSYLDLSNLHPRSGNEDVLNGIAYDKTRNRLFVTGKLWPKLYEIKVVSKK